MKQILGIIIFVFLFSICTPATKTALANENNNIYFDFIVQEKNVKFDAFSICKDKSKLEKWNRNLGNRKILETVKKIKNMGFSSYVAMQFIFPGMNEIFDALEQKINIDAKNAKINLKSGKFVIENEIIGSKICKEKTAEKILAALSKSNHVKIEVVVETLKPKEYASELLKYTNKKSQFSTWCGNSSAERKHNIALALSAINEKKIMPGEKFSFNQATGTRSEQAGYKKAKIISNGTFVEGTGGGVCQVSTTLYNAAVLAGLEIVEIHQHSLPVSYVEPSRDAMVNGASADLIFRNNTAGPIFLKAKLEENQNVVVEIFGEKNKFEYNIVSKITKILPKSKDEYVSNLDFEWTKSDGQTKRISTAKDGYESEAYLIKLDNNGNTVSKQKIRANRYAPTRGIVATQ